MAQTCDDSNYLKDKQCSLLVHSLVVLAYRTMRWYYKSLKLTLGLLQCQS